MPIVVMIVETTQLSRSEGALLTEFYKTRRNVVIGVNLTNKPKSAMSDFASRSRNFDFMYCMTSFIFHTSYKKPGNA